MHARSIMASLLQVIDNGVKYKCSNCTYPMSHDMVLYPWWIGLRITISQTNINVVSYKNLAHNWSMKDCLSVMDRGWIFRGIPHAFLSSRCLENFRKGQSMAKSWAKPSTPWKKCRSAPQMVGHAYQYYHVIIFTIHVIIWVMTGQFI